MITVADTAINHIHTTDTIVETKTQNRSKTVVICGSCGAQELAVDDSKTECPHCDDYIY